MYTEIDLFISVVTAICITGCGFSLFFLYVIDKVRKIDYSKGYMDGKKENNTRTVFLPSKEENIYVHEQIIEIEDETLNSVSEERAIAYIYREMLNKVAKEIIPFMEVVVNHDLIKMKHTIRARVKIVKSDDIRCDVIREELGMFYAYQMYKRRENT